MTNALTYLETLVRETHKPEAEVMGSAFLTGLRQLWREHILGRHLRGEIGRDEAIEAVGIGLGGVSRTAAQGDDGGPGVGTGEVNAAVADAGPLIHLTEIGCLPFLRIFDI